MMKIGGGRWIHHVAWDDDQRIGGLGEEERRLKRGVVAHFARMLGKVAPDAVDAAHREQNIRAADRQRGRRQLEHHVLHGGFQ